MTLAVNHKGIPGVVYAGSFSFVGAAALVGQDLAVLINGTELTREGQKLICAETPVSVAFGGAELSISTVDRDNRVEIFLPEADKVRNPAGVEMNGDSGCYGCTLEAQGDTKRFHLYNGAYNFTY